MAVMLCPTRGGEASIKNQLKAISIATQRNWEILFLYVSDIEFTHSFSSPVSVTNVQHELDEMGKFLLTMAQERAEQGGVTADILIRHGSFDANLNEVIHQQNIRALFLGSSHEDEGLTTEEYIRKLIQSIHEVHGIEIFVALNGEIIEHLTPAETKE